MGELLGLLLAVGVAVVVVVMVAMEVVVVVLVALVACKKSAQVTYYEQEHQGY